MSVLVCVVNNMCLTEDIDMPGVSFDTRWLAHDRHVLIAASTSDSRLQTDTTTNTNQQAFEAASVHVQMPAECRHSNVFTVALVDCGK